MPKRRFHSRYSRRGVAASEPLFYAALWHRALANIVWTDFDSPFRLSPTRVTPERALALSPARHPSSLRGRSANRKTAIRYCPSRGSRDV